MISQISEVDKITFRNSVGILSGNNYVYFSRNTYDDWRLLPLKRITAALPAVKKSFIQYEQRDGSYDLSNLNGVHYGDRTGKWTFKFLPGLTDIAARYTNMVNFLHGGRFHIELSTDTDCFYEGRVYVDEYRIEESGNYITLSYILDPYRYYKNDVVFEKYNFTVGLASEYKYFNVKVGVNPIFPIIRINETMDANFVLNYYYTIPGDPTVHSKQNLSQRGPFSNKRQFDGFGLRTEPGGSGAYANASTENFGRTYRFSVRRQGGTGKEATADSWFTVEYKVGII